MQRLSLILPILLPVFFWAGYHYHKDRHLPEPPLNLLLSFGLGLLAAAISRAMYSGLEPLGLRFDAVELAADNPLGLFAYAMLAIGPIEELSKLLPFVIVVLRFKAFDEPLDGIVEIGSPSESVGESCDFHELGELIVRVQQNDTAA